MDSTTDIDKLVENLSFQVLAGPCNKNIADHISKKVPGTPINVRIKFRHKNNVHRGVISVPKLVIAKTHEKLRLVSSDQTIVSFNFLMDTDVNKKVMKKTQKRIFQLFRPGVCLGSRSDDDDYPYMANSHVNVKSTTSVIKPEINDNKQNFGLKKNITIIKPLDDSVRPPKIFLGKCKPGGCLDPPFGEEKYVYEPVLVKSDDKIKKRYFTQNELQNSNLITYPSVMSSSELKMRNEIHGISHKIKEENHITTPNTYAYLQSYYIPTRSKDISVSSCSENVEKKSDLDNEILYYKSKNIVSVSKDSILIPAGCLVEPVLPTSVNLTPIQSNIPTLQNNVKYFEEKNLEKTKCMNKKCYSQISNNDFSFNSDLESDNISGNINHVTNILPQSRILTSEISNDFKIKEDMQIISSSNKHEEFSDLQGISNKQNNSVENEDKSIGIVTKHSIIIIAPIKNSDDINNSKKYTEPELQNNIIINTTSDIDLEVLELKEKSSSSINKLNTQSSDEYLEKQYIKNSNSLLTDNIMNISNTKNDFRDKSEIGENFNMSDLKPSTKSLNKKIKSHSFEVNINKNIIENSAELLQTASSLNEMKLNNNNDVSNKSLSINEVPFQKSALYIEDEGLIQEINIDHMKFLSTVDSSQKLSENMVFKFSGTTLLKQLNQMSKSASEIDSRKYNFETPMQNNNKETENVRCDNGSRNNIKILEKVSPEICEIPNELTIQSENKNVQGDDTNIQTILKSLGSINYDISNEKISDINNKNIVEINSFKNEPLNQNSFKSIYKQSLKNSNENIIGDFQSNDTACNIINSNTLKELEKASNFKGLTEINLMENIENKQEEFNTSPGPMNYDITNKTLSEISITEIVEIKSLENGSLNNRKSSIKPSQSPLSLNKNHENMVINKSTDPELRTINDLNLSQTAFNILNNNSLTEKVSNKKDFIESNSQSKLTNLENSNKLLKLVMENIGNEQENSIKSLKRKQDSTGYIKKEHSGSLPTHKTVLEKDLFYFDIALQMHINKNKQIIFKTVDSTKTPKTNKGYSLLLLKSEITANDDEMKIPIDSNTDIVLQVKKKSHEKSETGIEGSGFLNSEFECYTKQENTILNGLSNEGFYNIQNTLSWMYERDLVPVETTLRALKEEVDVLVRNQVLIREMLKVKKSMPARLVHADKKCACYRK